MKERLLIFGPSGRLGQELIASLSNSHIVTGVTRQQADITSLSDVQRAIEQAEPTVVINAAAMADVDRCEREPELARVVNCDGPSYLAQACRKAGIYFVHFSTDYVFDGRKGEPYLETDTPAPVSAYGRSKLAGEQAVQEKWPDAAVVRVSWLYGSAGHDFVARLIDRATDQPGATVKVVEDQVSAPTWTREVAAQLQKIIEHRLKEVVHAVAENGLSRCQFARELVESFGLDLKIVAGSSSDFPEAAPRPVYSVLDNARLKQTRLNIMRPYDDALRQFVSEKVPHDA